MPIPRTIDTFLKTVKENIYNELVGCQSRWSCMQPSWWPELNLQKLKDNSKLIHNLSFRLHTSVRETRGQMDSIIHKCINNAQHDKIEGTCHHLWIVIPLKPLYWTPCVCLEKRPLPSSDSPVPGHRFSFSFHSEILRWDSPKFIIFC